MSTVQGHVGVVMPSKFKEGEYRIKLNEVDTWFNASREFPSLKQGNLVLVKFSQTGKNCTIDGVKLLSVADPEAPAGAPNATAQTKDAYFAERDRYEKEVLGPRLSYQTARAHALQYMEILLSKDAFELPAAKNKTQERRAAMDGLLDLLTAKFFADANDGAALERAQEELNADPTPPKDEGAVDEEEVDEEFDE